MRGRKPDIGRGGNYVDADNRASKMLRVYSSPNANGTGVLNLEKFTRKATDYSVTWRQVVTANAEYKNGVILRCGLSGWGRAWSGRLRRWNGRGFERLA